VIFVTVGTNEARFDRLLHAIAQLPIGEELVVQHGHTAPIDSPHVVQVDFLPFEQIVGNIRRARVVVCHAGVGSIMVALANGKSPIVVPRRKSFDEAVDDHQLQVARRFAAAGLVTLVETPETLGEALVQDHGAETVVPSSSSLALDLRVCLDELLVGAPPARFA
jgi:UDP-N-acetylglucosamine transferase subunit ALG13